jgi:hypothetical protein
MKIERKKPEAAFEPLQITLETMEEVDDLYSMLPINPTRLSTKKLNDALRHIVKKYYDQYPAKAKKHDDEKKCLPWWLL